jgi:hypothetical protein
MLKYIDTEKFNFIENKVIIVQKLLSGLMRKLYS